jgi:hypothetical protein
MTGQGARCCAGLLTFHENVPAALWKSTNLLDGQTEVSNPDQLLIGAWAIMI